MSSRELYERLNEGDCNLATIYRSLHLLEELGLVKRFDFGDNVARYELVTSEEDGHHHHLVCVHCAGVVEIDDCFPRELEEEISRRNGFKGVTHKLEFFGVCPRCQ
jgi:Fur family ferric uptake transcriptional regulator